MTTICCPTSIKGLAIRVTRADVCGDPEPVTTPNSRFTTKAFVSLGVTPEIETGEETTIRLADGTLCVDAKDVDLLKRLTFELVLCGVTVPFLEMLNGCSLITNDEGDVIGTGSPSRDDQANSFETESRQLEVWSRNRDAASCTPGDTALPYVLWLFPLTRNWQLSNSFDFASATVTQINLSGDGEQAPGWSPSIASEYPATMTETVRNGGPWFEICTADLPSLSDCAYDPVGSGS